MRDDVGAVQRERARHLREAEVVADLDPDPAERRVERPAARRPGRRSGRRRGRAGASSGTSRRGRRGPTSTAALRSVVALALEQAADDVEVEPARTRARAVRWTGRGSPRAKGSASSALLEHVARDRALRQHEQLRARRLPLPRCRARHVSRFRSFSPSFGSICATATSIAGESNRLTFGMPRVRFYYDVVCPYSYMESHVMEAAEDAGTVEIEWLPFELRPAPKPLLEVRGDHLRVDWTQNVYRAGARARASRSTCRATSRARRCRSPRASGPASRAGCATTSTRSTRRSSAKGLDIATDHEIARAAERIGLDGPGAVEAAYSHERFARIREILCGGRGRGRRAGCRRSSRRTARGTGAWAASSATSAARNSCHASRRGRSVFES